MGRVSRDRSLPTVTACPHYFFVPSHHYSHFSRRPTCPLLPLYAPLFLSRVNCDHTRQYGGGIDPFCCFCTRFYVLYTLLWPFVPSISQIQAKARRPGGEHRSRLGSSGPPRSSGAVRGPRPPLAPAWPGLAFRFSVRSCARSCGALLARARRKTHRPALVCVRFFHQIVPT